MTPAQVLERHVVGDNTDRLYAHRVVTAAGTVGRFIFEGDAKQCAALPALITALDRVVALGCGGYNNHAWTGNGPAFEGGLACERCGITPAVAEVLADASEALEKARSR